MNVRRRLKAIARQRRLIAYLFDAMVDAAEELKDFDTEPAVEGQLADCIRSFEADLRDCVDCLARTERALVQKVHAEPKLGVG